MALINYSCEDREDPENPLWRLQYRGSKEELRELEDYCVARYMSQKVNGVEWGRSVFYTCQSNGDIVWSQSFAFRDYREAMLFKLSH